MVRVSRPNRHSIERYPFFFFKYTATTEIYTLSLHDALPISADEDESTAVAAADDDDEDEDDASDDGRSEEHTSELQSRVDLVCRLLHEKKKMFNINVKMMDIKRQNVYSRYKSKTT